MTKAQLIEEVQELQRWREAISDAMQSAGLGALQPGTSPVLAMDWIIAQHLEVAGRERVEPLTEWQVKQLELGPLGDAIATVRKVERALGVVEPGEELLRVGVSVLVPDAACELLASATDDPQGLWDKLLHAGGALEPVDPEKPDYASFIKARPIISRDPTKPKLKITEAMLSVENSQP